VEAAKLDGFWVKVGESRLSMVYLGDFKKNGL
jgi:hypothetical protein